MFRVVVVLLEIALLIILLRTSYVQYMLSDTQSKLSSMLMSISESAERLELSSLRESLKPVTDTMRDYEAEYVHEVLSSKHRISDFHRMYCVAGDKNPYVYGNNLNQMCKQIDQSHFLHNGV